jgi:MYND finger
MVGMIKRKNKNRDKRHAVRSDSVHLMICSRCEKVWFCSKECWTHAWKYKGHRAECEELQPQSTDGAFCEADEETITKTIASVREKGIAILSAGNVFLMYDGERNEYFDSLTNDSFHIYCPTATTVGFPQQKLTYP